LIEAIETDVARTRAAVRPSDDKPESAQVWRLPGV